MTAHVVHTLSKKVSKMSKAEYNLSKNKGNILELSGRMTRMCFESPNLQGMGAGQKRAGVGRAGYVKWEVLTPLTPLSPHPQALRSLKE